MANPLLKTHRLPPFDQIKSEYIVSAITKIVADNRKKIAALVQAPINWESTVLSLRRNRR